MSDTQSIFKDIQGFNIPPIDKWQPDKIVDFDILIDRHGNWYHEGDLMRRRRLVKLFASVMRREQDGHYYLITPPTKYRITVEDVPLMIVQAQIENSGSKDQAIYFRTNLDDEICLGASHDIDVRDYQGESNEHVKLPYVYVRQGLYARLSRQVFLDFVDLLTPDKEGECQYTLYSQSRRYQLKF